MLSVQLMLCAMGVVVDQNTNNVSIFNILESLSSPGFPLFVQKIDLLCVLERDAKDKNKVELELRINNNKAVELFKGPLKVDFQDKFRNRSIVNLNGMAIPNPGKLNFVLYHDNKELAAYSVEINQIGKVEVKS